MNQRLKRTLRITGIVLALTLLLVLLGVIPVTLSPLRGPLQAMIAESFDTDLDIEGSFSLRLGPRPRLKLANVRIAKLGEPPGSLATVASLTVRPGLFRLLQGDISVKDIVIDAIRFDYCAPLPDLSDDPPATTDAAKPLPNLEVASLTIADLRVDCSQHKGEDQTVSLLAAITASAPGNGLASLRVDGELNGLTLDLDASAGNINRLLTGADDYPYAAQGNIEGAAIQLDGTIHRPSDQFESTFTLSIESEDTNQLLSSLGIDLPVSGPFALSANTVFQQQTLTVEHLEGRFLDTRLSGSAELRLSTERPDIAIVANIDRLGRELLPADNGSDDQQDVLAQDLEPVLRELRKFDASLDVSIEQLADLPFPVEDLHLTVALAPGALTVSRLHATVAGGTLDIQGELDFDNDCPELETTIALSALRLASIEALLSADLPISGEIETLRMDTSSCGSNLLGHRDTVVIDFLLDDARFLHIDSSETIDLEYTAIGIGWQQVGSADLRGKFRGETFGVKAKTGSLEQVLGVAHWPLVVELAGAGAAVRLDGNAAIGNGEPELDAAISLNATRFGSLHRWLPADANADLPLNLDAELQWAKNEGVLHNLDLHIGNSDITGSIRVVDESPVSLIVTDLTSERIDLSEIASLPSATSDDNEITAANNPASEVGPILAAIDLNVSIGRLTGHSLDLSNLKFEGQMRDRLIDGARLSLNIEESVVVGEIDIDVREEVEHFRYHANAEQVDIGQILVKLDVVPDLDLRTDALELTYQTSGAGIQQLADNSQFQAEIRDLSWNTQKSDIGFNYQVAIDQVNIFGSPGTDTTINLEGSIDELPFRAWASLAKMSSILGSQGDMPATLVVGIGRDTVMLQGDFDWDADDGLSADIVLSGQVDEAETSDLSEMTSPLRGFQLSSSVTVNARAFKAPDLRFSMGSSEVYGSIDMAVTKDIAEFEIGLQSPHVQTNDFVTLAQVVREVGNDNDTIAVEQETANPETVVLGDIVADQIEAITERNAFDVRLTVDQVSAGDQILGGAELHLIANQEQLRIEPLTVDLPGGKMDASYVVESVADGFQSRLNISIEQLQYGDLLRLFDSEADSEAGGLLYLETSLTSEADKVSDLRGNTEGDVELLIVPRNIEAGFLDLWAGNIILAALPAAPDGASSKVLNCMVATFRVDDGVMTTKDEMLDSTDIIVRGRGTIDLGERVLDIILMPQAKREKFFSISAPLAITGSFDDPIVDVAPGGLTQTLLRWYMVLIYVPFKWLTGERFPMDGIDTCFGATEWQIPPELVPVE